MPQMAEMVGMIPNIAAIACVLEPVCCRVFNGQAIKVVIEALGHVPMFVHHKGRVDHLQFGCGLDFHHTTSTTILPIAL